MSPRKMAAHSHFNRQIRDQKKLIELVSVPFHVSNCKVYLFKMINHIILERKMHAIYVLIHLGDFLIIAIARIKSSESVHTFHLSNP